MSTATPNAMPGSGIEYHWIDGVERLHLYEPGGYHPIMIGDILHNRYRVVDKLGFGGFSTIWLAQDLQTNSYVAVKVGVSNSSVHQHETSILRLLSSIPTRPSPSRPGQDEVLPSSLHVDLKSHAKRSIPVVLDEFDVRGPNGTHPCYTLSLAQGDLKTASYSRLFPIRVARALSAGLTLALAHVHSHGYVHGDLHLRNVLIKLLSDINKPPLEQFQSKFGEPERQKIPRVDGKPLTPNVPPEAIVPLFLGKKAQEFTSADARAVLLSDFGTAFAPAKTSRLGKDCNTPVPIRAPEALFEPNSPLSYPSDVWSLATAIWDIVGMKFMFGESETEEMVAAQQIDVLGSEGFPSAWLKGWKDRGDYFVVGNSNGREPKLVKPTEDRDVWPVLEQSFEDCVQKYRRKRQATGEFEVEETKAFLSLMRQMLRFRPEERLAVGDVLRLEWMVKWALPELERSILDQQ